jgi:hypothetical protein
MYDIFISYRRESGSEFASFLYDELKKMGYEVFLDAVSLRAGPFEQRIDEAIDQCSFFLLLLAPNDLRRCFIAPRKDWLLHESKRAIERGKTIIPIFIKAGVKPPRAHFINTLKTVFKNECCDLSGVDAVNKVRNLLPKFLEEHPATLLAEKYNKDITDPEYIKWELETLKSIYSDIEFVEVFGREYPAYIVQGSESVKFSFKSLSENGILNPISEPLDYKNTPHYHDFKRIVGPHVHYPDLYGYTSNGFNLDEEGKICGLYCTPRTYKETVYTCHILQYELWDAYQKLGKNRPATLDDLPMRKRIHEGKSNYEVIMSGCNRSALNDVSIAVIDYNEDREEYCIATAVRTENVATFPGYFSFIPSGGYELYELEKNQNESVIRKNFSVIGALYREYMEELLGDKNFGQATGDDDLNRIYRNPKIMDIKNGVKTGKYKFEFLGVDFDLITLRQTLAFVLRIDDENFDSNNEFRKNEENKSIEFKSLKNLESDIAEANTPVMVEAAATYALLQKNHLYEEIISNHYKLITT